MRRARPVHEQHTATPVQKLPSRPGTEHAGADDHRVPAAPPTGRAGTTLSGFGHHAREATSGPASTQCRFPFIARAYSSRLRMFSSRCMSVRQ